MGDVKKNADLNLLENNRWIPKCVVLTELQSIDDLNKKAQQHKNHILEPTAKFTCKLYLVVIYIFFFNWNIIYVRHCKLAMNE